MNRMPYSSVLSSVIKNYLMSDFDEKQVRLMDDYFFKLTQPQRMLDETLTTARARSIYMGTGKRERYSALSYRSNKSSQVDISIDTTSQKQRHQKNSTSRLQRAPISRNSSSPRPQVRITPQRNLTPAQESVHIQLERQCKRIDPQFQLRDFLSSDYPERSQNRKNKIMLRSADRVRNDIKMMQTLKLEKRQIGSYTRTLYKPHDKIIRKLRRIYQNKQHGETELSTETNQIVEQKKEIEKRDIKPLDELEERRQRWQRMKNQRVNIEDIQKVLKDYNSLKLRKPDRKMNMQQKAIERQKLINELKLKNSPMSLILQRFGGLVEHFYMDFKVPMKQIVDFYQPEKIDDDNMQSFESIQQDEQFKMQQNRIKHYFERQDMYSRQLPSKKTDIKDFHLVFQDLIQSMKDTGSGIKQNISSTERVKRNDVFQGVRHKFYEDIEVKSKLF